MTGHQIKSGEQHIPALITGRAWRIFKQSRTNPRGLLVVLLEELNDQPPFRVEVWLGSDEPSKIGNSHRLVTHIHSVTNAAWAVSRRRHSGSCASRDFPCGQPAALNRGCHRTWRSSGPCPPPSCNGPAGHQKRFPTLRYRDRSSAVERRCSWTVRPRSLLCPSLKSCSRRQVFSAGSRSARPRLQPGSGADHHAQRSRKPVTNQVTTAPDIASPNATCHDGTPPLTCGNATPDDRDRWNRHP